ncbi:DUF1549 domain-containing protein [Verrucomicrobiaceae bacterium 5K15]|uniref:DUF1549 domain-containing protein n=1 Tax=Oceaniferula flava TaxID=2800421 RepID=A0AAE2S977_9BACT|nr:DUF1549 domain-containing protein [Oceaniferula flavus]MBK1853998.1 DUF1549 domain-containing protein [Oceaniferula flavus]MBM1135304.1 DUF1549 domain-containing protein [Oceaniferula flavus]
MKNPLLPTRAIATVLTTVACLSLAPLADAKAFSQETVRSTSNEIDQLVAAYLQKSKVKANPVIDDATFMRRAYISIGGRIPTSEEAREFLTDTAKDKRKSLVDALVHSQGYQSQMFNFWADLLRLQTNDEKYGLGWHQWIRSAVENNMPYDQFVNEMLAAEGMAARNPAVGYYLRDRNMLLDNVSNTAQVFLGTQIGCAQCHDHPFDDLTQKQYFELAAFMGGTTYKSDAAEHLLRRLTTYTLKENGMELGDFRQGGDQKSRKKAMKNRGVAKKYARDYASLFKDFRRNATGTNASQQLRLPKDYQYNDGKPGEILTPKTYFGDAITNVAKDQRRKAFAGWVTSPSNPRFTKVIVNRLWAEVFGRGIVEPLDDWSETTRVSHPELLDYLCEVMKATDYDVQQFMRVLYHTRLFESAVASEQVKMGGSYDFRGPILRRMSAEEIHDSMLVLEFGNKDSSQNSSIQSQWQQYTQSTEKLFKMSLPELVALDEASDAQEKILYAARAENRKLKLAISKAKGAGEMDKVAKLERQLREGYRNMKRKMDSSGGNDMMAMMAMRNLRMRKAPMLRASEQPAPFRPGTFMRQFGASDRETSNASNQHASIPQALTLLNGKEIMTLTDGKGKLAREMRASATASQKLETLFLTIYGSMPTPAERERFEPLMGSPRQVQTLAKAMLNSKRFLFVQ